MACLLAILALEIWPMITLIRWRSLMKKGAQPVTSTARTLADISTIQAGLVMVMVLLATAMARGIGFGARARASGSISEGVILQPPPTPARLADSVEILFAGDHYPGQVHTVTGETWYGLFHLTDQWELAAVKVTVQPIHNACADRPGENTGRRVTIDRPETPLFLVRGLSRLRVGPVRTFFSGRQRLFPGETQEFQVGRGVYWMISALGAVASTQPGRATAGGMRASSPCGCRSPWDQYQGIHGPQ